MGQYDDLCVVGVDCEQCHQAGMFLVSMRPDSSHQQITDLSDAEELRFLPAPSIDAQDVEAISSFLQEFKGDVSQLFNRDG